MMCTMVDASLPRAWPREVGQSGLWVCMPGTCRYVHAPCLHLCAWCMYISLYMPYSMCDFTYVDVFAWLCKCRHVNILHAFLFVLNCICLHSIYKPSCYCLLPPGISCGPAPNAPANGQRNVSGTIFESTVMYSCDPGYIQEGDNISICRANGQWSWVTTHCSRKLN